MKRHIVRAAGLTAAAIAGLAGCQSKQAQNTAAAAQPPLAPVAQAEPATRPSPAAEQSSAGAPDMLKLKAENWARELAPQLTKRERKAAEPSAADFLEPDQFHIGPVAAETPKPSEPKVVPVANPVVESTPSVPNQGVAIAPQAVPSNTMARAGGLERANVGKIAVTPPGDAREPVAAAAQLTRDASPGAGDLETSLAKSLQENPKDVWAQLDFQLLQFLKDKPTPQLDAMTKLAGEDRELIASVMDALTNFRNALRADNNMLMSRKVRPILDLADRVRAQADLVIPTLALCTKVDGFGIYEPIEPARFTAMKPHEIIVYCEVENFASHQNSKKFWETKLSQEVVLYTETGLPVWQDKTESIPDLARNRRHDFFVVKKTKFPPNITLGRYLMKVTIVDQQASRVAEATIPVQFVAQ
jgi:hypothetical protein